MFGETSVSSLGAPTGVSYGSPLKKVIAFAVVLVKKKKNLNDSPRVSQLILLTPRVMQSEREAQSERGEEENLPKEGGDFLIGFWASV